MIIIWQATDDSTWKWGHSLSFNKYMDLFVSFDT